MQRRLGALIFAGVMGLGAAAASGRTIDDTDRAAPVVSVAVQPVSLPATGLRDEAAMVLVGSALIGLGAALRRSAR